MQKIILYLFLYFKFCLIIVAQDQKKTPYQGTRRTFGHFKCPECAHFWFSANSWANTGQQCNNCNGEMVYPFRQHKLKKSKNNEVERKNHRDDLCEKCKLLGMSCTQWIEEQRKKKREEQEAKKTKKNK